MGIATLGLIDFLVIICAFAFGGFVKGVVGIALPMLAMAILTMFFSVQVAVSLITIPTLAANLYQSFYPADVRAAGLRTILRRFWPLLVTLVVGIAIGTAFLAAFSSGFLLGCLGVAILVAVGLQIARPGHAISESAERWATPLVGSVAGVVGGMAGLYGPLMAVYLAGLRLPRDTFICSISIANLIGSVPLTFFVYWRGIADIPLLMLSTAAIIPMFLGLLAGQKLRHRINARLFSQLLQAALFVAALNFLRGALS